MIRLEVLCLMDKQALSMLFPLCRSPNIFEAVFRKIGLGLYCCCFPL